MIGRTISHYVILDKLGEGGMGVVYKARDTELGRLVAIKALHAETLADEGRRKRFLQEARTASALNHPNIITIYEIAHVDGRDWIVMEYVDGAPLRSRIGPQGLPVKEAVGYAAQIASALGAAHDAGIVHRDIKPANILVSSTGLVKVADFGLAKFTGPAAGDDSSATRTVAEQTAVGTVVGTVAYMSPEQAQGERLDGRSDVFSLGVVLYEMLTGRRPFQGDTHLNTLFAILHEAPAHPHTLRSELDPELERIVERALAKKREARYRTAAEMTRALSDFQIALTSGTIRLAALGARLRRPRVAAAAVVVVLVAAAGAGWLFRERSRARWARDQAIPQVARLVAEGKYVAAFDLAGQAEKHAAADPRLKALWPEISRTVTIETQPSDAEVSVKEYGAGEESWRRLGRSPLRNLRVPYAYLHWKLGKAGFETAYAARPSWAPAGWEFQLHPEGATPPGMVPVPAAQRVGYSINRIGTVGPFDLEAYFIDRYEVTNREYKRFVDTGGYQERKYWKQLPSWEEGMKLFRDSTGRPGPSTWEAGSYPAGQDEFPVSGVSWYEAAAYAEFAGKSLPTIAHWYRAAEPSATSFIVQASNFSRQGPARVGQYQGIGPFGTADMGGNVKEWCWNDTGEGHRYLLGGAWDSPPYQFHEPDAQSPFARAATYGFRCVRYHGGGE